MIPTLIAVFKRRWPILIFVPLVAMVAVVALTPDTGPSVPQYNGGLYLAGDPVATDVVLVQQAAVDMKRPEVATRAAEILDEEIDDPKRFAAPLKVRVNKESLTIRLSVTDPDKERAGAYPAAFAQAFLDISQERLEASRLEQVAARQEALERALAQLEEFRQANALGLSAQPIDVVLESQLQTLQGNVTQASNDLLQAEAQEVTPPYRPQNADETVLVAATKLELPETRSVRAVLAGILAILGAIALAAFVERLNPRIDAPADAERIVGAPVLAMVPIIKGKRRKAIERADLAQFSGPFAESFRAMRSHLDFRSAAEELDRPPCVMIVSSAPGEGKTTSTAFLALSYAEVGRDVLVIGADFRRPAVHRLFGVPRAPGLSSRLVDRSLDSPEETVRTIVKRDEQTGVRVVPSGPGTDRVTGLLNDLKVVTSAGIKSGCTVILDTAPVMVANDAVDFLPMVDWVVIVVRLGRTTERSLRQTIASLELNEAQVAGCIMVGSLESNDAKRYYYSYYKVEEESDAMRAGQVDAARRGQGATTPDEGDVLPGAAAEPREAVEPSGTPTPGR